jgi:hypothetical protein
LDADRVTLIICFGVAHFGFRVYVSGFGSLLLVSSSGFGFPFRVRVSGFGFRFRVSVSGFGFRVEAYDHFEVHGVLGFWGHGVLITTSTGGASALRFPKKSDWFRKKDLD